MRTLHAEVRAKQRGIPRFIDELLDRYGHVEYDGRGARVIFFDRKSRRDMERDMGREPVRKLAEWDNAYKVVGKDGLVITLGRRYQRIHRK